MEAEQRGYARWNRFARWGVLIALALGLTMGSAADVRAAPFTSYFDALIAELEARSAELDPTDKVEKKQKKAVDKVLKAFAKNSTGLAKDLKAAVKAAKTLAKAFPDEFEGAPAADGAENVAELLLAALLQYEGDIEGLLEVAQAVVDSAPPGKCKDKAQAVLDDVAEMLLDNEKITDLASLAKALAKALKTVLKGQKLADKAVGCLPKLSSGLSIASISVGGETYAFSDDEDNLSDDTVLGTYNTIPQDMFVLISSTTHQRSLQLDFVLGSDPVGSHPTVGAYDGPEGSYTVWSGTVDVIRFPSLPGHVSAVFTAFATGCCGTVGDIELVGTFSVYTYEAF